MNSYTVSFFGTEPYSRGIEEQIRAKLFEVVSDIVRNHPEITFIAGRNGRFDSIVAGIINDVRRWVRSDNSVFSLVLENEDEYYKKYIDMQEDFYDDAEICELSSNAYPHISGYVKRRYMTDRSDLAVFYLERDEGEVYDTYLYALDCGKEVINIGDAIKKECVCTP